MKEISVSFLKEGNYKEYIRQINETDADYIHFDVMDGKFVQTKNLPLKDLTSLLKISTKKNDVHLMVENPNKYIETLSLYNIEYITIHIEINNFEKYLDKIINYGIKAGIAISPETNIEKVYPYLTKAKEVLIMGVHPGKSGQEFLDVAEEKIIELKKYLNDNNINVKIAIDGGVNDQVLDKIKEADIIVSASYILNDFHNIQKLKEL